jgi:pimeloyl-ACP methyl ester carboxylesterase
MASVTVSGETSKRLARAFVRVFGRLVFKVPSDPQDFLTTLEADLNHDTTGRLDEISTPTLIIGGSEDPFFSESLLRETAEKIPDAPCTSTMASDTEYLKSASAATRKSRLRS